MIDNLGQTTDHHVHGSSWHDGGDPRDILEHFVAKCGVPLKDVHAALMVGLRDVLKDVRKSSLVEGTRTKELHRQTRKTWGDLSQRHNYKHRE